MKTRRITAADITHAEGQYNLAVCTEISAQHRGDPAACQAARAEQARLREHIEWLKEQIKEG